MLPYIVTGALQMWLRILRWGDYPSLSRWTLNITTNVLTRGRQRQILLQNREDDVTSSAEREIFEVIGLWNMKEGVMSQWIDRIQKTSKGWKRKGNGLSPRASRGSLALLTPWFQPSEIDFRLLLASRTYSSENTSALF